MHFITFLSQLSIKLMFSAILLSFGRGSDWDQLLYAVTELPASFLRPVPALILYVRVHANVRLPLPSTYMLHMVHWISTCTFPDVLLYEVFSADVYS